MRHPRRALGNGDLLPAPDQPKWPAGPRPLARYNDRIVASVVRMSALLAQHEPSRALVDSEVGSTREAERSRRTGTFRVANGHPSVFSGHHPQWMPTPETRHRGRQCLGLQRAPGRRGRRPQRRPPGGWRAAPSATSWTRSATYSDLVQSPDLWPGSNGASPSPSSVPAASCDQAIYGRSVISRPLAHRETDIAEALLPGALARLAHHRQDGRRGHLRASSHLLRHRRAGADRPMDGRQRLRLSEAPRL
jgi:hypothetical protein